MRHKFPPDALAAWLFPATWIWPEPLNLGPPPAFGLLLKNDLSPRLQQKQPWSNPLWFREPGFRDQRVKRPPQTHQHQQRVPPIPDDDAVTLNRLQ